MTRAPLAALLLLLATAAEAQTPSTLLKWTAPGDDGSVGTATAYEARFATSRPDTSTSATFSSWWAAATPIAGLPAPLAAGTLQSVTVAPAGGFASGLTYWFAIRAVDDAGNWAAYSNLAWRSFVDIVAPSRVTDFR